MPVLQVPAGDEGGSGGCTNLHKQDGEEDEVRYSGGQLGGEGGHVGQIPLGPFCHLSPSPAARASRFFSPRRS